MDLASIKELIGLRLWIAFVLDGLILVGYRFFLFWLPFLPSAGIWVRSLKLPDEYMFVQSYLEFTMAALFLLRWVLNRKDNVSLVLLAIGLFTVPSTIFAALFGHFMVSAFITFLIIAGAGVYMFYVDHMEEAERFQLVDATVLVWIVLGLFIKYYATQVYPEEGQFYQIRGGSIWGSNHVAGILLLLLPLVRRRWLSVLGIAFLLFQFSRGIYIALAAYGVLWFLFVDRKPVLKLVGAIAIALVLIIGPLGLASLGSPRAPLTSGTAGNFQDFLYGRILRTRDPVYNASEAADRVVEGLETDQRFELVDPALKMARDTMYGGVGLGGFAWGLGRAGYYMRFSNAHNVFLTALAEGGALFALGLIGFLLWLIAAAYGVNRPVFVGLAAWALYGLGSAEIYEVGGLITAGDYYTLLFVAASVVHARRLGNGSESVSIDAELPQAEVLAPG